MVDEDAACVHARRAVREHLQAALSGISPPGRPSGPVIVVGVYLTIVVFFETNFFPAISKLADRSESVYRQSGLEFGPIASDQYRRLFFHSALIYATLNRLLLGVLIDGRLASGIKYAIGLVAACTGAFLVAI